MADFTTTGLPGGDYTGLPAEYQSLINQARMKQAIAQQLQARGVKGYTPNQNGPIAVRENAFQGLAGLADTGVGAYLGLKGMQDENAAKNQFNTDQKADIARILALPEEEQGTAGMTSRFPQSNAFGKTMFEQGFKTREKTADVLSGAAQPDAALSALKGVKPPPPQAPPVQGPTPADGSAGDIFSPAPAQATIGGYPRVAAPAPTITQTPTGETNADGSPKTLPILVSTDPKTGHQTGRWEPKSVNVSVNTADTADTAFARALGPGAIEQLKTSQTGAMAANQAMDALGNARADYKAGIDSGMAAPAQLAISKFGKALGIPGADDPTIANTESFKANMARETLNLVKGLGSGAGISNADRDFAEKASGGSISMDPAAISRLMDIATAAAGNKLIQHEQLVSSLSKDSKGNDLPLVNAYRVPFNFAAPNSVHNAPDTNHLIVDAPPALPSGPKPAVSVPKVLTKDENAELAALRKRFGITK